MEGHAKIASLMGRYPEVAITRRFGALNARNLLYMQAELTVLENRLRELSVENEASTDPDRRAYSRDWETLYSSMSTEGGDGRQWETMIQIRDLLKQYSKFGLPLPGKIQNANSHIDEAVLVQSMLMKLKSPRARNLQYLQVWMERPTMGNVYLLGADSDIWSDPNVWDLIALDQRPANDMFSAWVSDSVLPVYHRAIGRLFKVKCCPDYIIRQLQTNEAQKPVSDNTVYYADENILRVASVFSTSVACGLMVACIIALYYIVNDVTRLIVLCVFTVVFAFGLGIFTSARQIDIFTATAAYVRFSHIRGLGLMILQICSSASGVHRDECIWLE
jgi:hypothetical protein